MPEIIRKLIYIYDKLFAPELFFLSLHRATMNLTLTRIRIIGVVLITALAAPVLIGQSSKPDPWLDFPSYDSIIVWRLRQGADAKEAARRLVQEPEAVDTFTRLVRVDRLDDALLVLKRTLDSADAAQTIAAMHALNETIFQFQRDQTRYHAETIRQLIVPVRARIATLPREDAARLAREMLSIDASLDRGRGQNWPERLAQFVRDYDGTEAALLTQVDLLTSNPRQMLKQVDDLDQFAKNHPGTNAGAKALYLEGFQLHVNVAITGVEPRGSDPTERLLRVAAIVKELESGTFPRNEWVKKAPDLMVGFFVSDTPPPAYSPANLDRAIDAYGTFVRTHLELPSALGSLENSLGYVIATKMGNLFQLKGDRVGGIERTLDSLEKTAADPGLVQLFRAQYYARQSSAGPEADRAAMAAKARASLTALVSANRASASRHALAFAAAFDYYRRDYARALPEFQQYVAQYPSSPWAPIAALRIGECYEQANDWPKASAAYTRAAAMFTNDPYARVLGGAFASRTLDAQGRFDDSLAAATGALNSWDADYGFEYTIRSAQAPETRVTTGPFVDRLRLIRDDLAVRVATLGRDLRQPGGRLLARGRWQLDQNQFTEAVQTFTTFLRQEPESPGRADAQSLLHRAQLELALDLASVEGPHYDRAKAAAALDSITKEPFDSFVATAAVAKAALMMTGGQSEDAEALMATTLESWVKSQRDLTARAPAAGIDADIAEIRQVVFRPLGDLPVYGGMRPNAFTFPDKLPRFIVGRADVQVKTADGRVGRHTIYQGFPDLDHVLLLTSDQLSLVARLVPTIGGTKRRAPTHIMETPNQPVGSSQDILALFCRFFPARPGHWGGWELETYPAVTQIEFVNADRTKANASVTIGYSGATVMLEKINGKWRAVGLTNQWVT
ncbi:MAG TPA: tetratricopeptide repeat protein [Pyrinomonadaceae bacterium]|nr:tetratricopeptide repeat protein [Pyrinomonadaceae bacterium]